MKTFKEVLRSPAVWGTIAGWVLIVILLGLATTAPLWKSTLFALGIVLVVWGVIVIISWERTA